MKRFRLHRRAFLGGAAAAIALPFLEAMLPNAPRAYAQGMTPKRMLAYYFPNGMHMPSFTPSGEGAGYALSETLAPLAPHQNDFLVLTGLANRPAQPDGPGDHAAGTGSFITATHVFKTEGSNIQNGVSVDQVAAGALGEATRFSSLQLGMDGGGSTGNCDSGYSCAYARNISWAGPQTPLPKTVNPQIVFDRLFAGLDPQATATERAKRKKYQNSVLDVAIADAEKLKGKLGAADNAKVDEYLTAIRELERQINEMDEATLCGVPARPGSSYDVTMKARVMADLMVTAMQCDLTRVVSFMLANAGELRQAEDHQPLGGRAACVSAREAEDDHGHRRCADARQYDGVFLQRDFGRQPPQSHRHADYPRWKRWRGLAERTPRPRFAGGPGREPLHNDAQRDGRSDREFR
jgi:hypothetical protein